MHRTRNAAYGQPYRGFESPPLRQIDVNRERLFSPSKDSLSLSPYVVLARSIRPLASLTFDFTAKTKMAGSSPAIAIGLLRIRVTLARFSTSLLVVASRLNRTLLLPSKRGAAKRRMTPCYFAPG